MTGSAVLTHTHVSVCDRRTDYGISVVHTRYSIDLLMRVKTSRELQTSKKAFRHAGRLFETARLRQTKSSSLLNYHTPTRSLRSANTNLLSVPRVRTTFASRSFSVAAPNVWNLLPSGIRDSSSSHTFRCLLKTHCFQQAFGSP